MRRATSYKSLSKLDKELSDRLEVTLDAATKFELETMDVLADLATPEDERGPMADAAAAEKREYAADIGTETTIDSTSDEYSERQETLAKVVFNDGDAFHFVAVPSDGEIGVTYIGGNAGRWLAATSELPSPLRLYVSIAPPDAPLPWLLAAVDKQKDRLGLVGERQFCDRVDEPLEAESDTLRLRVPGLPGGPEPDPKNPSGAGWLPVDHLTVGGFCGWNGEHEFEDEVCNAEYLSPIGQPNIIKCNPEINFELTHNSILGGSWKRRKCAAAKVAACGSPTRIRHQYRKLGFLSGWHWVTANDDVVGPAELTGSLWLGIIMRRRRIIYQRAGGFGGFRAWSGFSRHLLWHSDRRLKANISRVGTTVFGLPLYRFSYLGSDEMFTGVMAQDVLGVMPQAVSRDASGFYRVNYGMLGIEMKRAA
jgi:Chaperone of endosialidase